MANRFNRQRQDDVRIISSRSCKISASSNFLVHTIAIVSLSFQLQDTTASWAKHGCQDKCWNITIPFPFGIGPGCYLDKSFEVTCNNSHVLPNLNGIHVLEFSLDHYMRVYSGVASTGYNDSGESSTSPLRFDLNQQLSYSHTQNWFMAIGCDIFAYITDSGSENYTSGCVALCANKRSALLFPCSGIECCQAAIPKDLTSFVVRIDSINTMNHSWSQTAAFIVDKDFPYGEFYNTTTTTTTLDHSTDDMDLHSGSIPIPAVLNWVIGNITCHEARVRGTYVCDDNTDCIDSTQGLGYRCQCWKGYQGNPYLPSGYGCEDIDECKGANNTLCPNEAHCYNTPGSYLCSCPPGYHSDDSAPGYGCKPFRHLWDDIIYLGIGTAVGVLILFIIVAWLYGKYEKRKKRIIKREYFKRNGGLLMERQITSSKGSVVKTKVFCIEELEKATDNFNHSRVLGRGGHGTVFKGMLPDGSIVAVKRSNIVHVEQVRRFINEVLILSHIHHRNIVKLLGCCLESEVPLLVYEYVSNGTLSHHLHDENHVSRICWDNRLRIAGEVAGALAYLHSHASTAIFHRDIKSSNILLDENHRAIVSDFGLSRSIPLDKTHLTTIFGGTLGYLDPDYFRSGKFTDKSDVYAFGVVLTELLTGQRAMSSNSRDEGLVIHFRSSMKHNLLFQILDMIIVNEGRKDEILGVAKLAKRCLKLKAKKRPSMKEVAADLDRRIQERPLSRIPKTRIVQ